MEWIKEWLSTIVMLISALGTLGGIVILYYKLRRRFEDTESSGVARKAENALILRGLFACLDGLHQQGCNGEVTKCHQELQQHIIQNRD